MNLKEESHKRELLNIHCICADRWEKHTKDSF